MPLGFEWTKGPHRVGAYPRKATESPRWVNNGGRQPLQIRSAVKGQADETRGKANLRARTLACCIRPLQFISLKAYPQRHWIMLPL